MTICCCRAVVASQRCYWDVNAPRRVIQFDTNRITANPNNRQPGSLAVLRDGNTAGPAFVNLNCGVVKPNVSGLEFEMGFYRPQDRVTAIRIHNNGGNILGDGDGIDDPTAQIFDINHVAITAPFTAQANNGGGPDVTLIPGGPLDNVGFVRFSDLAWLGGTGDSGGLVREIDILQYGISPAALVVCPEEVGAARLSWVDARTGASINPVDITTCRGA